MMVTDKTMCLSVESKESYKAAAKVHVKDDEIIWERTKKMYIP